MTPLIFGFLRPPWFNSSKRRPWFVALAKIWRKRYSCTQKTFVSNKKSRHDTPRATILLGPCISPTLQPKLAYDTFISQVTIFLEKLEGSPYNFPIQWLNHVLTLQDIELMGFLLRFLCLFLTRDPVIFLENIIFGNQESLLLLHFKPLLLSKKIYTSQCEFAVKLACHCVQISWK